MGEDRSHTVRATDELIAEYKDRGFLFTTVTEMMQMRPGGNAIGAAPEVGRGRDAAAPAAFFRPNNLLETNPFGARRLFMDRGRRNVYCKCCGTEDEIRNGHRPQMIDVRTASEYASVTSLHYEHSDGPVRARRKDLRLEDGMVLVCKAGSRARIVAGWLAESANVRVLEGGTDAWLHVGLETVTSVKTRWSLERQVRLGAGLLVLTATILVVAGVHGAIWLRCCGRRAHLCRCHRHCMMGILLAKMPWNQARTQQTEQHKIPAADKRDIAKVLSNNLCHGLRRTGERA